MNLKEPAGSDTDFFFLARGRNRARNGPDLEVIVILPEQPGPRRMSALEFVETLPPGPRAFATWEEYEQHLREERKSWNG